MAKVRDVMCGEPATVGYVLPLSPAYQPPPFRVAGMSSLQPVCERCARAAAERNYPDAK
jgi:hypothetical protein